MGRFNINKRLLRIKGHFFLWNAGTAPVTPFLSVYARQLGFSSVIVGIIYTVMPLAGSIAKPLMGAVADRFKCQRAVFLTMLVVTAVSFISILYVPTIEQKPSVQYSCDLGLSVLDTCFKDSGIRNVNVSKWVSDGENITAQCELNCPLNTKMKNLLTQQGHVERNELKLHGYIPIGLTDPLQMSCLYFRFKNVTIDGIKVDRNHTFCSITSKMHCEINCDSSYIHDVIPKTVVADDVDVYKYYQFWIFLALMTTGWVGQAVVVSVSDTVCFEVLDNQPNKYGMQRSFGALGWGIFSIIAGLILDRSTNPDGSRDYTYAFYMSLVLLIIDFYVSMRLKYEQKNVSASIARDVCRLLANIKILIYMFWCVCVGLCTGLMWNFFFWLLEDLGQGADWLKTLEGLAMAIQCLGGEMPFFFISGWIIKRIGHVHCMTLVLLVLGLRFIVYSLLTNPWWALPIEVSNGITFGLFYATMASYASVVSPPGTETTVQGLVGAVFEGIGVSIGSFLGGILLETYGSSMTYRIFGIGALLASLLHGSIQFMLQRTQDMHGYTIPEEYFTDDQQELKLMDS